LGILVTIDPQNQYEKQQKWNVRLKSNQMVCKGGTLHFDSGAESPGIIYKHNIAPTGHG
jgi:hypothetical protein